MAPSTPPPPASAEFAAFTIASAVTRVMSPTTSFNNRSWGNFRSMANTSTGCQNDFPPAAANVHFVLDTFDGRARIVPVQAGAGRLVHFAENLRLEKGMNIMNRINLCGRHLCPEYTQAGKPR